SCSSSTTGGDRAPVTLETSSGAPAAPRWVEFGPKPMEYQFAFSDIASGRVTSLLSLDASTIVLGSASGGIWRTTNADSQGADWNPLTDTLSNLNIGALAQDPTAPRTLYAGTGEGNLHGVSREGDATSYGIGIYRSTDGGLSWSYMPSSSLLQGMAITRIIVDPADARHIMVATRESSITHLSPLGLVVSADAGAHFHVVQALAGQGVFDLAQHPSKPSVVLAATASSTNASGPVSGQIMRSTDGGATWGPVQGLPTPTSCFRISLASAPSRPDRFYALVGSSTGANGNGFVGLYGSDDGGATWVALGPTAAIVRGLANTLSKYVNVVAVDPADASVVYLGGVNLIRVSGLDFTQTANGTVTALTGSSGPRGGGSDNEEDDDSLFAGSPHVDHHAIVFDAAGNLIDATDAGPWRLPHPS
ncbi:MAG: hypothetical protein EB084_25860, partial [Proteobacteria bacterium]|nr:hypothetical protein [Pseudomonadota bacterium]